MTEISPNEVLAPKVEMLDYDSFDTVKACNVPVEVRIKHPATQAPTPIKIWMLGKHSDIVQDYVKARVNAKRRADQQAAKRGKEPPVTTVEQDEADQIELLTLAVFSSQKKWEGVSKNKQAVEFTVQNIKMVITESQVIRDQLDETLGDVEAFFQGSQTT
jgi:hypothetical protein